MGRGQGSRDRRSAWAFAGGAIADAVGRRRHTPGVPKTQDENQVTRSRRFATSYLFVPRP